MHNSVPTITPRVQSFVSKTTPRTRAPCFGEERNFAIMRNEAHHLHFVVHQLRWKLGVLTPVVRGVRPRSDIPPPWALSYHSKLGVGFAHCVACLATAAARQASH